MSSRWICRSLALTALLVLALPVVATAQTSRVEGMALQGDFIKDYSNIYAYPAHLSNVGNLAYAELGTHNGLRASLMTNPSSSRPGTMDRSVGVVLGNLWDGTTGTWGVHLAEETPSLGQGDALASTAPGSYGGDPNQNRNEAFDLLWGRKFGTTSLGLRLNRSFYKSTDEIPGVTTMLEFDTTASSGTFARNILGLGGGLGFEVNPRTNVDFGFLYQSRTYEGSVSPGGSRRQDSGPSTYMFSARAMWEYQPNWMIMPVFKWYSFDLSQKRTAGGTVLSTDNSLKGWQAGAASNWTLGANDLLVVGVTFAQNRVEQDERLFTARAIRGLLGPGGAAANAFSTSGPEKITETFSPQLFAALETHVNNWLTLRFGATKGAFHTTKAEGVTAAGTALTQKISDSPFDMRIGAGVKVGTLQLDAILDNSFPQTLGWLGSGTEATYFPKVSATYAF